MDILQKMRALGAAGKFDLCCEGGSNHVQGDNKLLAAAKESVYLSKTEQGVCKLFKTLMTNKCNYDCAYCPNSTRCEQKKITSYTPNELASVFNVLLNKGYAEGLFLSSGIAKDPDQITEEMIEAVKIIRLKQNFRGYIHFKILPGTSRHLIKEAAECANRLSINIEAPSKSRLSELSSVKDFNSDIIKRQFWIRQEMKNNNPNARQTTQMIVGANDETDLEVLKMVDWEYRYVDLYKAYFSSFKPVKGTPLEKQKQESITRAYRLYNTDFLFRKYQYKLDEVKMILDDKDMLPLYKDPKMEIAKLTIESPVDINEACYDELLRVPGIGPKAAKRIMEMRKNKLKFEKARQLQEIGVIVKRARPFLDINGSRQRMLTAF